MYKKKNVVESADTEGADTSSFLPPPHPPPASPFVSVMNIHSHSAGTFQITAFYPNDWSAHRSTHVEEKQLRAVWGDSLINVPLQLISFTKYPVESQSFPMKTALN